MDVGLRPQSSRELTCLDPPPGLWQVQVVQDPATGGTFVVKAGAARLLVCSVPLGTFSEPLRPLPIPTPPPECAYEVHASSKAQLCQFL